MYLPIGYYNAICVFVKAHNQVVEREYLYPIRMFVITKGLARFTQIFLKHLCCATKVSGITIIQIIHFYLS